MSMIWQWLASSILLAAPSHGASGQVGHSIVTSDLISITAAAARSEGYVPGRRGTFLQELRTPDGHEPLPGYESVGLYYDGHLVRSYAVRIETGDIVDPMLCEILRFPRLVRFRSYIIHAFASKEVPASKIAEEVGCDHLKQIQ
jgi:hypothetical protein